MLNNRFYYIKYGYDQIIGDDILEEATDDQLELIYTNLTKALALAPSILDKAEKDHETDFGGITLLKVILDIESDVMRRNIATVRREMIKR